ncbi:MAG: hypothetical protein Q9174_001316 [Haloplaca sp. 1 TL-2023]
MAKGLRSSVKKANKARLKARVFGPVEEARKKRLSAKLLATALEPSTHAKDDAMVLDDSEGLTAKQHAFSTEAIGEVRAEGHHIQQIKVDTSTMDPSNADESRPRPSREIDIGHSQATEAMTIYDSFSLFLSRPTVTTGTPDHAPTLLAMMAAFTAEMFPSQDAATALA